MTSFSDLIHCNARKPLIFLFPVVFNFALVGVTLQKPWSSPTKKAIIKTEMSRASNKKFK